MKCILACDPNGGIGYQNRLPWNNLQGDLFRFKQLTTNQTVVMGKNTWNSLPKRPLPNRTNIVLTSGEIFESNSINNNTRESLILVQDLESAVKIDSEAWIIGGAQLIKCAIPLIQELHLSIAHQEYKCDTWIDIQTMTNQKQLVHEEHLSDHTYQIWKSL